MKEENKEPIEDFLGTSASLEKGVLAYTKKILHLHALHYRHHARQAGVPYIGVPYILQPKGLICP